MNNDVRAAYYDARNKDFYVIIPMGGGKYTIGVLDKDKLEWKVLRKENSQAYYCKARNPMDAESILRLYISDKGLPAEKCNYVKGFFPQEDKICTPLKKLRYI